MQFVDNTKSAYNNFKNVSGYNDGLFDHLSTLAGSGDKYSPGYAILSVGSISFAKNSTVDMCNATTTKIANAIFAKRSIESICWAFGAWEKRKVRHDRIQEMCNILTGWINKCVNELIM